MENQIIGLKKLRQNIEKYIAKVKKGESFVVVKRSRPVFKISSPFDDNGLWENVVDFTKIKKEGVRIEELLFRL